MNSRALRAKDLPEIALAFAVTFALVHWSGWTDYLGEAVPPSLPVEALVLRLALGALLGVVLLMAGRPAWRRGSLVAAGVLLALIFFEILYGLRLVDPRHYEWIMRGKDGRWHLTAWQFFRREPWHFPPGRITNMLYPVGTSIGSTDSLPLAAFVFKPFSPLLADDFQYFGAFFLLWALLNGVFAALLVRDLRAPWTYRLLALALLVWTSSFLNLDHAALSGASWMTLAALWLYFRPYPPQASPREILPWLALAAIGATTHPYVCVMVLVLCAAGLVRRWWPDRAATLLEVGLGFAAVCLVVLGLWWLAGYFALGGYDQLSAGALGIWSMDLLSPINPARAYGGFLPSLPMGEGQYEGTHYLGAAMVALTLWASFTLAWQRPSPSTMKALLPLLLACALLTMAALSPKITAAGHLVLELPPALYAPLAPFRASGRFFLPVVKTLFFLLLCLLASRVRPHPATLILALILIVQMREQSAVVGLLHNARARTDALSWNQALAWDEWREAIGPRREIALVPRERWDYEATVPFVYLAARSGLVSRGGEAARVDHRGLARANQAAEAAFAAGQLSPDTLYVLHPDDAEGFAASHHLSCRIIGPYHACHMEPQGGD